MYTESKYIKEEKIDYENTKSYDLIILLIYLVLGIGICVNIKYENLFDLANYHYYNPFAFFNNRQGYDISPASVQTYYNPLLDIPLFLMIEKFNDNLNVLYAFQGIWLGLVLFFTFKITTLIFNDNKIRKTIKIILCTMLVCSGESVRHQIGTSTNEIQIAVPSLITIYYLLKMIKIEAYQRGYKYLLLGILMGFSLGLKPTIIYLCIALGGSLIICFKYLKRPFLYIFLFAIGGLTGFLISNGWWMYKLWTLYQNPFFPYLNKFFKSPYFDDYNMSGTRFVPSFAEGVIFPYIWGNKRLYNNLELPFKDKHGAVYYTIILIYILQYLIRKHLLRDFTKIFMKNKVIVFSSILVLLGYISWINIFAVYRYFLILEVLLAILFIQILFNYNSKSLVKFVIYYSLVVDGVVILSMNFFESKDTNEYVNEQQKISVEEVKIPENTLIKTYGLPTAGVAVEWLKKYNFRIMGYQQDITPSLRGLDFADRGAFAKEKEEIIKKHKGPIIILYRPITCFYKSYPRSIQKMHRATEGMYCRYLENSLDVDIHICVPKELKDKILSKVKTENNKMHICDPLELKYKMLANNPKNTHKSAK